MADELKGVVAGWWRALGFGFIRGNDGTDFFCHRKDIVGFSFGACLQVGERVAFLPREGPRGPRAAAVRRLAPPALEPAPSRVESAPARWVFKFLGRAQSHHDAALAKVTVECDRRRHADCPGGAECDCSCHLSSAPAGSDA